MKTHWKRLFFWSSLGSLAVGAAVALAKKAKSPYSPPLECHKIPRECQTVSMWTEQFQMDPGENAPAVQDKYVLRVTPFKVWSVLELSATPADSRPEGSTVYHVTHFRYAAASGSEEYPDEGKLQDRFYGTVSMVGPDGKRTPANQIARGGQLSIRKCLVGGASNGVETDEVHLSMAPVLNYRFEYISA